MNNVADKLYNILGTKFNNTDIKTLDSSGKETTDMEEIEMFSFDFLVDSRNYGPVVILLSAEENLEVYYGDNTSKSLDRNAKKKWENLIEHLSTFARSNRLGFSLKHTTDLKYDLSNITDITESYRNIFEGYYGTRKTSYSPQGKAKIIIKHSKAIGEDDKRFRNISQIFIENADGERFKLPFKKLAGARAMARHVTEGGNPYDLFGVHISEMVNDINTLGGFVRRSKMYEGNDDAMGMVETGRTHYNSLRKGLKQIAGVRGYNTYKEGWEPSAITEMETDTSAIRSMFMDKKVNQRTEDALPLLARLQQMAEAQDAEGYEWDDKKYNYPEDDPNYEGDPQYDEHGDFGDPEGEEDLLTRHFSENQINEKAPPGMEDWIKSNKAEFIDQYGAEKGLEVLYATAWERHNANESQDLTELTEFSYRGFTVEINPYKKGFAARARNRGGKVIATAPGKTEEEAFDAVKPKVDELVSAQKKVTGRATLDFNADFTQHLLKGGEDEIWVKVEPGPTLVIADGDMLDMGPEILKGYGFSRSGRRNPKASDASTPMLGVPLTAKQASNAGVVANGRYVIADVAKDEDGNRVYDLHYDSTVAATGEKFRMGVPAVTVGTLREATVESDIEWPEEVKGDEFPGDTHPDQDDWGDDDDDEMPHGPIGEGDSLRPTEKQTYVKIKDFNISALKGYARRIGMTPDMIDHDADVDFMIDEIMGYLYDDDWERNLVTTGVFNEGYDEQRDDSIIDFLRANKHRGAFDTLTLTRVAKEAGHTISAFELAEVLAKLEKEGRVSGVGKTVGLGSGNFSYSNWTVPDEMNEVNEFEKWADNIVEGTLDENIAEIEEFMATEQPVGIDAMNAKEALSPTLSDDTLFDDLDEAAERDPETDARPIVKNYIETMYRELDYYEAAEQAKIVKLYKAINGDAVYPHEMEEGCSNDLDADNETQLNASINKHVDAYVKTKDTNEAVNESVDLVELMQRTNRLLRK